MPNNNDARVWADWFRDARPVELLNEIGGAILVGAVPEIYQPSSEGKRGEELFHLILSGIREVYEVDAVIAGGAVRDLAAGITNHKDVDVWLPLSEEKFLFSVLEMGWVGHNKVNTKQYKKNTCAFETSARYNTNIQNIPVDILLLDKPLDKETVDKFPVHTQRCIYTLEGGLALSPEAQLDIDNKTFTIDPTITDKKKIKGILTKVKGWQKRAEYKGWKIVEPDIPEWWEAKEEIKKTQENLKDWTTMSTVSTQYAQYWKAIDENGNIVDAQKPQ